MSGVRASFDAGAAAGAIRERIGDEPPDAVLVLGSGLSGLADDVADAVEVPFSDVPGFPSAAVAGHAGRYVAGTLEGRRVLVQAGRFHLYEGHPMEVVGAPIRVAHRLGARALFLTNAAGAIARELEPGAIMLIDDHVNLMWASPLTGPVKEGEERFPDMSAPYDPSLQALARRVAATEKIPLVRGTYAAVAGPSYETPAEVRMLERCGAHAVGMSTVPEVVTARARGLRCVAFSLITNRAAGLASGTLSHDEVLDVAHTAGQKLGRLLRGMLRGLVLEWAPDPPAS
jgi:purine-nucleoside phosphorylase